MATSIKPRQLNIESNGGGGDCAPSKLIGSFHRLTILKPQCCVKPNAADHVPSGWQIAAGHLMFMSCRAIKLTFPTFSSTQ